MVMRAVSATKRAASSSAPWVIALLAVGCASTLKGGTYELHGLRWEGVKEMSRQALEACLASQMRDAVTLRLGLGTPKCGQPPFDSDPPRLRLWSWPWEPRAAFDPAIFSVDQQRIERWYKARGYYEARVLDVEYRLNGEPIEQPTLCNSSDCDLDVKVIVEEGKPVLVAHVDLKIAGPLPIELATNVRRSIEVHQGMRFDEIDYKADEARISRLMAEGGYARASVSTQIEIDRVARTADVRYQLEPGPPIKIGLVRIDGGDPQWVPLLLDVAHLPEGSPYRASELQSAERALHALGVFSSVDIEPSYERAPDVADLTIHVHQGRLKRLRFGVGIMSGSAQRVTSDELESVPEWDIHLSAKYDHSDFLGGMRKLHLEERPRMLFLAPFPRAPKPVPDLGNTLSANFEQPNFIEHRTRLFTTVAWDYGPDPFFGYFRHDLAVRLGLRRDLWRDKLGVEVALQHDLYEIQRGEAPADASSYRLPFVEERVKLDLRNDAVRPTRGAYFTTAVQEAVRLGYGSWNYVRVLGEARTYERLFLGIVLAQRVRMGGIFIGSRSPSLDPFSAELGPQSYRLRGGGADGNRGFAAGKLGDGIEGGKRRWEASLELRVPLGGDLGLVMFLDAGDVGRSERVHFNRPQAAAGLGLRYYTVFAPIRLDAGWRIPGWQYLDGQPDDTKLKLKPSAMHLTIGEAF